MSRAIGLTLTIAGLVLAVWFGQGLLRPQPPQGSSFIVAAIAVAMISVGVRYIRRSMIKRAKSL